MWTRFMDMHSGGGLKEKWQFIYVEAPQAEAEVIFYNRFGHNPNRITCSCCGEDYSVSESETLEQATDFDRNDETFGRGGMDVEKYKEEKDVLVIPKGEIKEEERHGELPQQGWVWVS